MSFIKGSFPEDIPHDKKYDVAIFGCSIHYCRQDIEKAIAETMSHINSGGLVFIIEPNERSTFSQDCLNEEGNDQRTKKLEI